MVARRASGSGNGANKQRPSLSTPSPVEAPPAKAHRTSATKGPRITPAAIGDAAARMIELRKKALAKASAAAGVADAPTEAESSPRGDLKQPDDGFRTPPSKRARVSPERKDEPPPGHEFCFDHQRWEAVGERCFEHDGQVPDTQRDGEGVLPVAPEAEALEGLAEEPAASHERGEEAPEFEMPPGQPDTPEVSRAEPKTAGGHSQASMAATLALPAPGQDERLSHSKPFVPEFEVPPGQPDTPKAGRAEPHQWGILFGQDQQLRRSKPFASEALAEVRRSTRRGRTSRDSNSSSMKEEKARTKKGKAKNGMGTRKARGNKRRALLKSFQRQAAAEDVSTPSGLSRRGDSRLSLEADEAPAALTPQTDEERKHAKLMYMRFFRSARAKKCPEPVKAAFEKAKGRQPRGSGGCAKTIGMCFGFAFCGRLCATFKPAPGLGL